MNVIQCSQGHFYDADDYATCPHCGKIPAQPIVKDDTGKKKLEESAIQVSGEPEKSKNSFWRGFGRKKEEEKAETYQDDEEVWQGISIPLNKDLDKSVSVYGTQSEEVENQRNAEKAEWEKQTVAVRSEMPAMPEREETAATANEIPNILKSQDVQLPVGYLVFTEGAYRGATVMLKEGVNTIGRSQSMDIVLEREDTVSRNRHTSITYNAEDGLFLLEPAGKNQNPVCIDGCKITENSILHNYAYIQIGACHCIFIALCGDGFQW